MAEIFYLNQPIKNKLTSFMVNNYFTINLIDKLRLFPKF